MFEQCHFNSILKNVREVIIFGIGSTSQELALPTINTGLCIMEQVRGSVTVMSIQVVCK